MTTVNTGRAVLIDGDGVAAACCARLLSDAGVPCVLAKTVRPKLAAVLLGEQTQHLLRELFPACDGNYDLFAGFPSIRRRIVRWGAGAQAVVLPHLGVVAAEEELLRRLWKDIPDLPVAADHEGWRILSSRGAMSDAVEFSCGTRQAHIATVSLMSDAESEASWVESVSGGWLFLLSLGGGSASLICVGESFDRALEESTLVARQISTLPTDGVKAAAYPRMLQPLTAPRWLACGTAAMSFDPLCGEGTGNAVREAFLAAAVVRAALSGGDAEALAAHYTSRLQLGFLRHLQICQQFYNSGGHGEFWSAESDALRRGIGTLEAELQNQPAPRYRLKDRTLLPIDT
jgi:hypothetical protein